MSTERVYDLEPVRADGWFDRVIAGVPALDQLCQVLGEPLVALSLVAGFRIRRAVADRTTGEVVQLDWVRDLPDGMEIEGSGTPERLRAEVLVALLGEVDAPPVLPADGDVASLRASIGQRYILLAPLFGLTLRRLLVNEQDEPRVVVIRDGVEQVVPLRQLRRYLRARVIDVLHLEHDHAVSVDLAQAEQARQALSEGRPEEVVARLSGWVGPLMLYHRTPEGASLEPHVRSEIARALGLLAEALVRLHRVDEAEDVLRLALQYAHDNASAPSLYRALATVMMEQGRYAEAIGPLRRTLTLDPNSSESLIELATCYLEAGRVVAAYGCLRTAREKGIDPGRVEAVEKRVRAVLGDAVTRYEEWLQAERSQSAASNNGT